MIRQPVSRISFDRLRGFLGVHLQEGAMFVDSAWNEGVDISWSLLRDAVLASGLEGTAGRELLIEADVRDDRLRDLRVCGTSRDGTLPPRPFYANGLPVLWPADLDIDQQRIGDAFRSDAIEDAYLPSGSTWIDVLRRDVPYEIYLRARVATYDRLDDPFLDDPGLDAARGTFRKRVLAEVRIRKQTACPPPRTNIKLSVDGSYVSDLNTLYRVELDALTGSRATPTASVLWDLDAGATVARVVDSAVRGARLVMVDTTERFADGFVRFEGKGVGPELYSVVQAPGLEGAAIQVTPHRCDRAERSLAERQLEGPALPATSSKPFQATFIVPPTTPPVPRLEPGDLITALPGAPANGPWTVVAAERKPSTTSTGDVVTLVDIVTLVPAGLAQPLATLDTAHRSVLREPVYAFDTTLTVDNVSSWKVGDRISIIRPKDVDDGVTAETTAVREDRVIVRIERPCSGETDRMLVRLDQPLAYGHAVGDLVIPEVLVRVRRFAGHACRVAIESVDALRDGVASLANFSLASALPLPAPTPTPLSLQRGLSIHLTMEAGSEPWIDRGDGWHFAARGDGWVETRMYAPVEEEAASDVVLAQLTMREHGFELIDLRPVPAALAVDDELARIGGAAAVIAGLLDGDPAADLLRDVEALSSYRRAQPALVQQLEQLVVATHSRIHASQACRPWLERLRDTITHVDSEAEPNRRELAAIAFALTGLAGAFSTIASVQGRKP